MWIIVSYYQLKQLLIIQPNRKKLFRIKKNSFFSELILKLSERLKKKFSEQQVFSNKLVKKHIFAEEIDAFFKQSFEKTIVFFTEQTVVSNKFL